MTDKLAHITVAKCVADWEARVIPIHVSPADFGRQLVRNSYAGGFGAAVKLLQRLEGMPADERAAVLKRLDEEATAHLLGTSDQDGMPRA